MLEATDKNIGQIISNHSLVVIDCWAPWCQPCLYFSPILEDLAKDHIDKIVFAKANIEKYPKITTKFQILGIPTILIFKNGRLVNRMLGVIPRRKLEPLILKHLEDDEGGKEEQT